MYVAIKYAYNTGTCNKVGNYLKRVIYMKLESKKFKITVNTSKYKKHWLLTCFVGCRLQMTSFPPYFIVSKGKLPLGMICSVVPKHILKSAILKWKQSLD